MLKRYKWPEWTPDLPETTFVAENVQPLPDGYRPMKQFSAMTAALAGFAGGGAFIGSDGTTALLGGNGDSLNRYSGTTWNQIMSGLSANKWRFAQFGDNVIGVFGGAPISFDLISGTAANLAGSPPTSDLVATARNQVFLAGDPSNQGTVSISGYNDSTGWTPGTKQALNVPFPSGGAIMGLAGGETALILQQRSIKRATYVGDVVVWQFDEISSDIGCMAKGSVAQAGQLVFFLSEQGFKVTDRNEVIPIGSEKVDRTFFGSYARADIINNITAAVDPRSTTVHWAMPGADGRIWSYNWTLKRWTFSTLNVGTIFAGFTANTSLEALDGLYPSGLESIPVSLDDPSFAGGNPLLLISTMDGVVGTLGGENMAASLSLAPTDIEVGRRVRIRGARMVSDAISGTVTVDARARAGDPAKAVASGSIRDNGRVPLRANGRSIGLTWDVPAGDDWSYAVGIDLEFELEGSR